MTTRATATFEITGWDERPYDEPAEGPKLNRITVTKTFQGEVTGESTAELLTCQPDERSGGYLAMERITGRIGDRAGSFVVQHGAVGGADESRTFGFVVPGSATGELRGLRGEVEYRHDERGTSFTLQYELE